MEYLNNFLHSSSEVLSVIKREIRRVETKKEIEGEVKSFLFLCLFPGLLIAVLVCVNWDTMVISWLLIMFLTRKINKEEVAANQEKQRVGLNPDSIPIIHKSRKIYIQISSLFLVGVATTALKSSVRFLFTQLFVQTQLQVTTRHTNDPSSRPWYTLFPESAEILVFESLMKWFSFIQYFSFYRLYLYFFMVLGSYVVPKFPAPSLNADIGDESDQKPDNTTTTNPGDEETKKKN